MPVTQKIIGEHLGLAQSVVAEALSGHPRISAHTRERVRAAALELGYNHTSNRDARALVGRRYNRHVKSGIVAVLSAPASGVFTEEMGAYFRPIMDGASTAAYERDMSLLLCSHQTHTVPNVLVDGTVDGVIILGPVWHTTQAQLANLHVPTVFVAMDRQWVNASRLAPDYRNGGRQIGQHLLALGHRRIAYLGHEATDFDMVPRLVGLREAMRDAGLDIDPNLIEATLVRTIPEFTTTAIGRLLERSRDFTALFCHNDTIAMQAVQALRTYGIEVPRDISIVGFDDTSHTIGFEPSISSVSSPRFEMGRRALDIVTANPDCAPVEELFPVQFVARQSTRQVRGRSE